MLDTHNNYDEDIDIFADIPAIWVEDGHWDKFDPSGVSLISHDDWQIIQKSKDKAWKKKCICKHERKKKIPQLLSSKPDYETSLNIFIK